MALFSAQTAGEVPGSHIFSMLTSSLFTPLCLSFNRRAFHCSVCVCEALEVNRVVMHVMLTLIPKGKLGTSVPAEFAAWRESKSRGKGERECTGQAVGHRYWPSATDETTQQFHVITLYIAAKRRGEGGGQEIL